jgi:SpoVK/Ycf46/Vps4 family AAA+-type ATPase
MLASAGGFSFQNISSPDVFNSYMGESEKALHSIFVKARLAAPSLIFFDEVDSFSSSG